MHMVACIESTDLPRESAQQCRTSTPHSKCVLHDVAQVVRTFATQAPLRDGWHRVMFRVHLRLGVAVHGVRVRLGFGLGLGLA